MLNESFKCFFAFTGLDLGPIGLALLAHIYGKVAICKSCEDFRRSTSNFRRSPWKQRFRSSTARTLCRGMVTVAGWSPAEISTSLSIGRSRFLVPRSPIKYPPRWLPQATIGNYISFDFALICDATITRGRLPWAYD
jgi:hypothetical protein